MVLLLLVLAVCKARERALDTKIAAMLLCLIIQFESIRSRWYGSGWGSGNCGLLMEVIL
jgi:hypothetical protein